MIFSIELLLMIFEKVDFINLIKLRSICKDWRYIIDNFKIIKQLTIDETIYTEDKIDNVIYLNGFQIGVHRMFKKIIGSNVLHDLKYLNYSFNYELRDKNKLIHLNCFKLLERLVLHISSDEAAVELKLVHPKINRLTVFTNEYEHFSMEINCPECEKLEIDSRFGLTDFRIIYPEKVKILELTSINHEDPLRKFYDKIGEFINVEQIKMKMCGFYSGGKIDIQISKLSKLKKIAFEFDLEFKSGDVDDSIDTTYSLGIFRYVLCGLINVFSKKEVLIFLENEQMTSEKQVIELIDEKIGKSLSLLIREKANPNYDSDNIDDDSDDLNEFPEVI